MNNPKKIKKTELILISLTLLAIVLVKIDMTGAVLIILFTYMLLSLFYFVFGFALFNGIEYKDILAADTYKKLPNWKVVLGVAMGWLSSIMVGGILFKVQHYPGAEFMLIVSLFPLAILHLIAYFTFPPGTSDLTRLSLFWRNYIMLGLGFVVWFAF